MIPLDGNVDRIWSEFEQYSTNDYIRQILDTPNMMSAYATNDDDELKRIPYLINDIKDYLFDLHEEYAKKWESTMETIHDLRVKEMQEMKESLNQLTKERNILNNSDPNESPVANILERTSSRSKQRSSIQSEVRISLPRLSSRDSESN